MSYSKLDLFGLWLILFSIPIGITFNAYVGLWVGVLGFAICLSIKFISDSNKKGVDP